MTGRESTPMPYYLNDEHFKQRTHSLFTRVLKPGEKAPASGIYRCVVCGHEAVSTMSHHLPPEEPDHPHPKDAGPIRWQLVAAAMHRKAIQSGVPTAKKAKRPKPGETPKRPAR
jgi:hypothetical protein